MLAILIGCTTVFDFFAASSDAGRDPASGGY
jgi:hypothetical protein